MTEPGARAYVSQAVVRVDAADVTLSDTDDVAVEEPLELRIAGDPLVVTMRTPGHDRELALGLLLTEGVIGSLADVGSVVHCGRPGEPGYGNTLDVVPGPGVALQPERMRRGTLTSSACGVCGRQTIDDLLERVEPLHEQERVGSPPVPLELVREAARQLERAQPGFARTGALHGAAILDGHGTLLAAREDVGRHNAVDKIVGAMLLAGALPPPKDGMVPTVLAVSGRVSFEIIQKAAMARVRVVCGVSAPTSLAVELAERAGITLAGFVRDGRLNLYANADRIVLG